jgi:hypothetical protein
MMPAGLLWAIAAGLIVLRVVWWLAANDKICRGPSTHDAGVPIDLADCPSVVAAFALSGADGGACYLLEHAASAAVAELAESGALNAQSNGDEAWISVGEPLNLASDDAMLVDMLSTRMSRSGDGSEVVDSGTLAHHPPRMMWWLRYRRAVTNRSRAAGITEARSAFGVLIGITAIAGLIGAVGLATGARSVISAVASLDPLALRLWWLVLGIAGGRLALDALHTSVERSDILTGAGRQLVLRLAHQRDQLSGTINPTHGLGDSADTALATAVGLPTRVARQVPLFSSRREPLMWSDYSGSLRLVRMHRDWRPGEGAHPRSALLGGLCAALVGVAVRWMLERVVSSEWYTSLFQDASPAVSDTERLLSIGQQVALVPLVGGITLAAIGFIDLFARRSVEGVVIDVRLPEERTAPQKLRAFLTGAGHDGVAIVEMTVERSASGTTQTFVVDARAAAPIGAEVTIEHTVVLRRVRSVAPRGTSGAARPADSTLMS